MIFHHDIGNKDETSFNKIIFKGNIKTNRKIKYLKILLGLLINMKLKK